MIFLYVHSIYLYLHDNVQYSNIFTNNTSVMNTDISLEQFLALLMPIIISLEHLFSLPNGRMSCQKAITEK